MKRVCFHRFLAIRNSMRSTRNRTCSALSCCDAVPFHDVLPLCAAAQKTREGYA